MIEHTDYTISQPAPDGSVLHGTLTHSVPAPEPARIGFDCPEADFARYLALMPRTRYRRYFDDDGWPAHALTGKAPADVLVHSSYDGAWNAVQFEDWAKGVVRPQLVTHKHEPPKKIDAPTYVRNCEQMAEISAEYPMIIAVGTILTLAWLRNHPGEAGWRPWMFKGMGFWGFDGYNDVVHDAPTARYRTAEEKWRPAADIADQTDLAEIYPEWGIALNANDPGGAGRAQALRDDWHWFEARQAQRRRVNSIPVCAGYWQVGLVGVGRSRMEPNTTPPDPGFATLQTIIDSQRDV